MQVKIDFTLACRLTCYDNRFVFFDKIAIKKLRLTQLKNVSRLGVSFVTLVY